MKRYLALSALTLSTACSTIGNYDVSYNLWEKHVPAKRTPASVYGLNISNPEKNELHFNKRSVKVCNLTFDSLEILSADKSFVVNPRWITSESLPFKFPIPDTLTNVSDSDSSVLLKAGGTGRVAITNPLLPDLPILPEDRRDELCPKLKNYHKNFFQTLKSIRSFSTQSAHFINDSRGLGLEIKPIVSYRQTESSNVFDYTDITHYPYDSLIIYDDKYHNEVSKIAGVHRKSGFFPKLVKLSSLPGLDTKKGIPEECDGDYLQECYSDTRISYVPGLIKALIRTEKKKVNLKGVLLVGSTDAIAPFYTNDKTSNLSTDLFYMLPDVKLVSKEGSSSSTRVMQLKSQKEGNPLSIVSAPDFQNYQLSDVIPVGRLLTRNDQQRKDPIVGEYAYKIHRWQSDLPLMQNNSVFSIGGSSSDTWTFLYDDLTQFSSTYGKKSEIYASEFLAPLSQCQGKCLYKTENQLLLEQKKHNRVGLLFTGHSGENGVLAPHGTLNNFKDGSLVGHVVANSCDLLNYSDSTQRSFGEQLIQVPNGGAVNTFFNSNVGFGGSDNRYNIKFMAKIKEAHKDCRPIGEALRLTVYDMIKGKVDGARNWQLVNRQFQGSPLNHIARMPASCLKAQQNIEREFRIK